mmetsp:Transcript_22302/g.34036  ORF Transcript_22302/g.34036 Transcript_22302/m.34036 type:complete len:262 (+) Transcript_22302:1415-2200(+)
MTTYRSGQTHRKGNDQAEEEPDAASLSGENNGQSSNIPFDYNSKAPFCIDRLKWISNKNRMKKTRAASVTNNIPRKDWDEILSTLKSGSIKSVTHSSSSTEHISYVIEDPISGKFHSTWNMPNEEMKASTVNPEDDVLSANDKILLRWISQSKKGFLFTCGTLAGISLGVGSFRLSFICNTICLTGVILLCSLSAKSSSHHHFFSTSSHSVNFILNVSYTVSLVLTLSAEKSENQESDITKVSKSILCVLSWFITVAYTLK